MAERASVPAPRTIVVGDVHGCLRELENLLDRARFDVTDRLVFVGDLVARGPDSLGVLALARRLGAIVVRGNHEERVLRALGKGDTSFIGGDAKASDALKPHAELARALSPEDAAFMLAMPLSYTMADHDLTVVHAGIDPSLALDAQSPETLLNIRTVKKDGKKALWGAVHTGPTSYVFGHNAIEKLQLHPFATGLDTGCVYGGELTALVLEAGEAPPRDVHARRSKLVAVPAERVWFDPGPRSARHLRDDV